MLADNEGYKYRCCCHVTAAQPVVTLLPCVKIFWRLSVLEKLLFEYLPRSLHESTVFYSVFGSPCSAGDSALDF